MQKILRHFITVNFLFLANTLIGKVSAEDDHGFGNLFRWKTVSNGFVEAKETRKPIMVFVHRSGCSACSNLRSKFGKSIQILDLSNRFIMINVDSETEELPREFVPDGTYIPRILFFSPDGKFLRDVVNQDPQRAAQLKYYYWNVGQIAVSMSEVLDMFPKQSDNE